MKLFFLIFVFIFSVFYSECMIKEITPYKFTNEEREKGYHVYTIPQCCRFTVPRSKINDSNIVYYLSKPRHEAFPIAILCGGSSLEDDISSIIHFIVIFWRNF